ncbi:MAG: hypothetical protein EBY73_07335, partial [Burkholderiaceae bacterium]|nr:hypothetical protein [Burkholderiaceae bacterium]
MDEITHQRAIPNPILSISHDSCQNPAPALSEPVAMQTHLIIPNHDALTQMAQKIWAIALASNE